MNESRTVLITGATGGIGQALTQAFLAAGDSVALAGRNANKLETAAAAIGERGLAVPLDVSDPESIRNAVAQVAGAWGKIDVLVNNAGIAVSAPLRKGEEWAEQHMQVNYHGPRRLIEAVLPHFEENGGGQVLQIASSAGLYGYSYTSAYCASKHALLGYSRAAAVELKSKKVAFHTFCPHFVDSPMTNASIERIQVSTGKSEAEARAALAEMNPDGAFVAPEQIAEFALQQCATRRSGDVWEFTGKHILQVNEGFVLA